jgi:hypothetical protein
MATNSNRNNFRGAAITTLRHFSLILFTLSPPRHDGCGFNRALAVVSQEVVDIEAGTGDGWFLVDAGVRTMPVVEVSPGS